jgi:hypothetical protein
MISSPSAQIEAVGGDHMKTTIIKDGKRTVVPDYARVQSIFIGTVAAYTLFLVIIGAECVPHWTVHLYICFSLTSDSDIGTMAPTLSNRGLPFRKTRLILPLLISAV